MRRNLFRGWHEVPRRISIGMTKRGTSCRPLNVLAAIALLAPLAGAEVVGWRTDATGRYPDADPPVEWSAEQHVVWSTPLPAWSNASPVIHGERIYLCAEPNTLLCLDRATGELRWRASNDVFETLPGDQAPAIRQQIAEAKPRLEEKQQVKNDLRRAQRILRRNKDNDEAKAKVERLEARLAELEEQLEPIAPYELPRTHNTNGYSSPTPVTDGRHVFALFGNGVAAAYDLEGNRRWITIVQKPTHGWGQSASPALADGTVVVLINELFGLDAATGEVRWTTPSRQSWASPIVIERGGRKLIVTPDGQVVNPADGAVIAEGLGRVQYNAPLPDGEMLYFIDGREGRGLATATRFALDDAGQPVVEKRWERELPGSRYYASAVVHDGLIYAVSREETFTVLDAADGTTVYERELNLSDNKKNSVYPSVTLAGDYLYLSSENGRTIVIKPGREYEQVAANQIEGFRGSPVFLEDKLYLRGFKRMWCFGS
jgi:outer membrane protein assembly factor BamB